MITAPELSTAAQNCAEAPDIEPQVANIVNALKQEQQEAETPPRIPWGRSSPA
jgi:hypothetical protein